jgi:hypothetical protein
MRATAYALHTSNKGIAAQNQKPYCFVKA